MSVPRAFSDNIVDYIAGPILSSLLATSAMPSWVVNPLNPPDLMFDFVDNLAWNKTTGGTVLASSLLTVSRASIGYVNDSAGNWTSVNSNLPRLSNLGLLVEEARTNVLLNSQAINSWATKTDSTVTDNNILSPDGTVDASLITEGSAGTAIVISAAGATAAAPTVAFSLLLKRGNTDWVRVLVGDASPGFSIGAQFWVNLSTGVAQAGAARGGATLISVDNGPLAASGWVRVDCIVTLTASATSQVFIGVNSVTGSGSTTRVAGATYYLWQGQAEVGASVTSIIPTTTVAVTRAADTVTLTAPPPFGVAYSLYAKGTPQSPSVIAQPQGSIVISDGTSNNRFGPRRSVTGAYEFINASAAVTNYAQAVGAWAQNVSGKEAVASAAGDQRGYGAGVGAAAGAGALAVGVNQVNFGAIGPGSQFFNGFLEAAGIWATQRVPDAQLASMTT